ncbi:HlyC/CorC family transporter [Pseudonocardiaceae bacterium YIM PH 21723]|nr:HlyC/CorC family transporter [Pseudonocardiaceae bacterium YIM PH 21723]
MNAALLTDSVHVATEFLSGPWSSVLGLVVVLVLTLLTAVFVAAEFGLSALERSQVESHVQRVGDRAAGRVARAHRNLSFNLSGAQLGITITTITTGYIAEPAISGLLGPWLTALGLPESWVSPITVVVALLLATTLSMVLGELVPKNLAIAAPLQTARAVAGFQSVFSTTFRWLIHLLNSSANIIVRRMGIEPADELQSARSPQELSSLVRSSAERGTLDQGTATLLDRSLRFTERTAEDLMTPRVKVEALKQENTVLDLIDVAVRTGFSRFPVYDRDLDEISGMVHVKQSFGVPKDERGRTTVGSLARPVPRVPETLEAEPLLRRLRETGLQVALVIDEYGGTAGLVTMEDLVEEIVGDVRDEHDRYEAATVRPLGRNSWMVSGLLRFDEVFDATGFRMPDGDYETLAGLVLARLGKIPAVGDETRVDGWRITVMAMDKHRVAELRVTRLPSADLTEIIGAEVAAKTGVVAR